MIVIVIVIVILVLILDAKRLLPATHYLSPTTMLDMSYYQQDTRRTCIIFIEKI